VAVVEAGSGPQTPLAWIEVRWPALWDAAAANLTALCVKPLYNSFNR
jgi:hypothetical protein